MRHIIFIVYHIIHTSDMYHYHLPYILCYRVSVRGGCWLSSPIPAGGSSPTHTTVLRTPASTLNIASKYGGKFL